MINSNDVKKKIKTREKECLMLRIGFFISIFSAVFCSSCTEESKIRDEVLDISVTLKVERFDQAFRNANQQKLIGLKQKFPFLFSSGVPDSIWLAKAKDTLQIEITKEVEKKFDASQEQWLQAEAKLLLQHIKYYFPKVPVAERLITVTNNVDYRNKVVVTDSLILIALDTYLGEDHYFYDGMQVFLKKNFEPDQIIPDIATAYAKRIVPPQGSRIFVERMVEYGKELYFKQMVLPNTPAHTLLGYTESEYKWALDNESYIWRYFIEKELLYSTDTKLIKRFLHPAPFSKFYLEFDAETPDRLGQFIGWQIMKAYVKKSENNFPAIIYEASAKVFKQSRYKPKD